MNALAQIPELKVSARTSTFLLAEQGTDIATVASTLGVANVLEGSVRKFGDQVRITAQLIEVETEFHLWSETFDRELTDIFAIQDEIARVITDQLQVTLSGDQQLQLVAQGTENPDAHEAYLRGRYLWNQRTSQSMRNALAEFERAVELDPEYAEAYSGLADSYALVDLYRQGPDLGMAHASLGWLLRFTGEWENAEREFERAIELNPSYATAHQLYATYLGITGRRNEAVIHAQRSFELDPVSRRISANLARALSQAGRTEEAIEQYRETTELAPEWPNGWSALSWELLESGGYEEGLDAWATLSALVDRSAEAWEEVY